MLEKELYPPIKNYFESRGYTVRAEVIDTDVIAKKGEHLVAIELKTSLSMKVIYQALNRKGVTHTVYIAVPPIKSLKKDAKYLQHILIRLELGLLFVHPSGLVTSFVEPAVCVVQPLRVSGRRAAYHDKEFKGRSIDGNVAGASKTKILTAYKEKAIRTACIMLRYGDVTAKRLRDEFGLDKSVSGMLRKNFYGWFECKSRGVYGLTSKGREEVQAHKELLELVNKELG